MKTSGGNKQHFRGIFSLLFIPFPGMFTVPRCSTLYSAGRSALQASDICMHPGSPVASIFEAVHSKPFFKVSNKTGEDRAYCTVTLIFNIIPIITESPNKQYRGIFTPTTPATTVPE
jgi:hypothetical protein